MGTSGPVGIRRPKRQARSLPLLAGGALLIAIAVFLAVRAGPPQSAAALSGAQGELSTGRWVNWDTSGLASINRVQALAVDPASPATVYAAAAGSLYKTIDGGRTWIGLRNDPDSLMAVLSLAVAPALRTGLGRILPGRASTVYAGALFGGVVKSMDGGQTFVAANRGLPAATTTVGTLTIDPTSPSTVYAGTGSGIFKSEDAGATWTEISQRFNNHTVHAVAVDPVSPSTILVGSDLGLFRSTDGGKSWVESIRGDKPYPASTVFALAAPDSRPSVIYAGTSNGVFRSMDHGRSWSEASSVGTASAMNALVVDPRSSAVIFAGLARGGVWRSADGGEHWTGMYEGLTDIPIIALAISSTKPPIIYAGTDGGGFRYVMGPRDDSRALMMRFPQSPTSSEVAGSTPPEQTAARPTAERPIARSEKRVDATPSKNDIFSDPNLKQTCFERTREIMARLEAWQRTTSPGDAIGDKAVCLDVKARWQKWADECSPGWGTPAQARLLADWCESKSFTHVIILPSSPAQR